MRKFFKREEKLPFQFSAIEERRGKSNFFIWLIGIILLAVILTVVNTFLHLI